MDGWMEGWRDGGMEGWRDGGMEGWRDGGMDGWMDGCTEQSLNAPVAHPGIAQLRRTWRGPESGLTRLGACGPQDFRE